MKTRLAAIAVLYGAGFMSTNMIVRAGEFEDVLQLARDVLDNDVPQEEARDAPLIPMPFCEPVGYMNDEGAMVIPPQFADAKRFVEGRAAAQRGGKWGYIDSEGVWIVEPTFTEAGDYHDGVARGGITESCG